MAVAVKICGLTRAVDAVAAAAAGADFLGFIHFAPSPRHVDLKAAAALAVALPAGAGAPQRVGVVVDADLDAVRALRDTLALDMIQLHGPQSPQEVCAIRQALGVPVIKALSVRSAADIDAAQAYAAVADRLLFDAAPPAGATRPGGNAVAFPWHLMQAYTGPRNWLLAGGLTPDTVAEAVRTARAAGVDVASGVEQAPGIKSHSAIKAFIAAAKGASTAA